MLYYYLSFTLSSGFYLGFYLDAEGVSNSVGGLSDGSPARLVKSGGTNLIEKENRRGETISHRRQG